MFRDHGPLSTADAFSTDDTVNRDSLPIRNHTSLLFSLPVIRDRAFMADIDAQGLCVLIHHMDQAASMNEVSKIVEWNGVNKLARGGPGVDMCEITDEFLQTLIDGTIPPIA